MKTAHAIALTAIVSILATTVVLMGPGSADRSAPTPDPGQGTEPLESRGERPGPIYAPPASPPGAASALGHEPFGDGAEAQSHADSVFQGLENRFHAEAVSPVWAHNTELAVLEALVSDEAVAAGIALPADVEVRCRTSLCRINADYLDDAEAADAATLLAMDISEHLPRTHRRTVYQPDGSVELLIFAMK